MPPPTLLLVLRKCKIKDLWSPSLIFIISGHNFSQGVRDRNIW